jgi:hypothetical protein
MNGTFVFAGSKWKADMRSLLMATVAAGAMALGGALPALADDAGSATGNWYQTSNLHVSLTPRIWYALDGSEFFINNKQYQATSKTTVYPFFGITAEISSSVMPKWSVLLTGFYTGNGSSIGNEVAYFPQYGEVNQEFTK